MNPTAKAEGGSFKQLLPIMGAMFGVYVVMGLAMPVLPLHVHQNLHFGPFIVGLVSGSQFAVAMFSRLWAGHTVDSKGAKYALHKGVLVSAGSGLLLLLSYFFVSQPAVSVAILLVGRGLLGIGESFTITGALSLGLAIMGSQSTGKVMARVGTALYIGFAFGAPLGTTLFGRYGFVAAAIATVLVPLIGLPMFRLMRSVPLPEKKPAPQGTNIVSAVWLPGVGVALAGVAFGAISTFMSLLYASHGWSPQWLPFTVLSLTFIFGRLVFGHLPDKFGGAQVAVVCVVIAAVGQVTIWKAGSPTIALIGVFLSSVGYSLVYPALGVEAIRRTPKESRGLAMGTYTAFLDVSLGFTGPALGLVAGWKGLHEVFLVSAGIVLCAAFATIKLILSPAPTAHTLDALDKESANQPLILD